MNFETLEDLGACELFPVQVAAAAFVSEMAPLEPVKGALVEVPAGRGNIRFIGATQFSSGKWVGIELSEPKGKNDGSVMGVSYFSCKPNYGVFVRPSQVKVLQLPLTEPVGAYCTR